MSKSTTDKFANIAAIQVTEAVAGTTAYAKFNFPYSVMDKMALLISRIEYLPLSVSNLNSSTDNVIIGLIAASAIVDIGNQADPVLLDSTRLIRNDLGAAATGALLQFPFVKDFSSLPGGGILVAPSPLCATIQSNGAAGVMNAWVKFFYTAVSLSTDEYWELVESRRIIST
jgi:hypothetical protein